MESDGPYSILEAELRQTLLRGYSRLRRSQAQGRQLDEAERILELLGDPQVLTLEHPRHGWRMKIPLVFVASWDLPKGRKVKELVINRIPNRGLSLYKRRHDDPEADGAGIHDRLLDALNDYMASLDTSGGLLLDLLWAPRPEERDHTEIATENWSGFHRVEDIGTHWLFGDRGELPEQIRSVEALIRLTFPLYPERREPPHRMVTLILGLALEPRPEPVPLTEEDQHRNEEDQRPRRMRWARRLARILMDDIPYLNRRADRPPPQSVVNATVPDWLRESQRDALHVAIDELHRRIADFAMRKETADWNEPTNGFNFVVAFKELARDYTACLRYRLSTLNLHALGAGVPDVDGWRRKMKSAVLAHKDQLRSVFQRSNQGSSIEGELAQYLEDCERSVDELFHDVKNPDDARRKMREMIESTSYPMQLTPGFHVMNLSHPEIIRAWLRDPRARHFKGYPKCLLAWETDALPTRIYYSQIADASLPVGICGVNAEILDRCPAYYELQEIIDEYGPRLRYILCEEELASLRKELRYDLGMTHGVTLWEAPLDRFRRLAYFFLAGVSDYHTKLVEDKDIAALQAHWIQRSRIWWELGQFVPDRDAQLLMNVDHVPQRDHWHQDETQQSRGNHYRDDFLKDFLSDCQKDHKAWATLKAARLHRLKLEPGMGSSLLVLVPSPQNDELSRDLFRGFLRQCELAAEDYSEGVQRRSVYELDISKPEPAQRVEAYDMFICYNLDDFEAVREIAEQLKAKGLRPWFDRWELSPGTPWLDAIGEQLESVRCVAIFVGPKGVGPFQKVEMEAILSTRAAKGATIIPVLLLGAAMPGSAPLSSGGPVSGSSMSPFLRRYQWLDFNEPGTDPIEQLCRQVRASFEGDPPAALTGTRLSVESG
jgi:TIR domain